MLRRLPGRNELLFFTLVALLCAVIVELSTKRDYALMLLAIPVFFVASMMGMRRSGDFARVPAVTAEEAKDLSV